MPSKEPLCFWTEERAGAQEERQGYSFCNLCKRSQLCKFLLEILNDGVAIQSFFRGNVAN